MTTEKKPMLARYGLLITDQRFLLPTGTAAQRTASATEGFARYSTDLKTIEFRDDLGWSPVRKGGIPVATVNANTTINYNEVLPVNTTGGPVTITLPASPKSGDRVTVFDPTTSWGTENVTVDANGNKINKLNQLPLSNNDDYVTLVYSGVAALGWIRESGLPDNSAIDTALSTKAEMTYVDTVHERQTDSDVTAGANTAVDIVSFDPDVKAIKVLVSFIADAVNNTELFEMLITSDKLNNIDIAVTGEVTSDPSVVTFAANYNTGVVISGTATVAGVFKYKVLWESK